MPKTGSGQDVVKILTKHFDFFFVSQKGSHVKLRKQGDGVVITTIVPIHEELSYGTLRGVLDLAKVDYEEFRKFL